MKLFELVQKIGNRKLGELPLKIRYKGKVYTKKDANYTYYELGHTKADTLEIDTFDLAEDVEIVDERLSEYEDEKDVFDLCNKIRDVLDEIENLDLEDF